MFDEKAEIKYLTHFYQTFGTTFSKSLLICLDKYTSYLEIFNGYYTIWSIYMSQFQLFTHAQKFMGNEKVGTLTSELTYNVVTLCKARVDC